MRHIHELWYFGRSDKNIRPYKDIPPRHFAGATLAQNQKYISQAKATVLKIDSKIQEINANYWILPIAERDAVWTKAMAKMTEEFFNGNPTLEAGRKRKPDLDGMQYGSIYDNYIIQRNSRRNIRK